MINQLGFVHIIESPSAKDLLEECTEGRSLSEFLKLAGIPHSYNLVTDLETLDIALYKRLPRVFEEYDLPPILHLSLHGDRKGIGLTDGSFLSWHELREVLRDLNNQMEDGLLLCMSSCYGSYGYQLARDDSEDKPFLALVGNSNKISWKDSAVAYITFYHLLFKNISMEECVERMISASNDNNFKLWWGHEVKAVLVERMRNNKLHKEQILQRLRTLGQEASQRTASRLGSSRRQ